MEILGWISTLFMGISLGLVGGGGSILTVPILVYFFSLSPVNASAFSLFVVGVTSFVGFLLAARNRLVNYKVGVSFSFPSLIGILISRRLILPSIPSDFLIGTFQFSKDSLIMIVFSVVMLLASWSMIRARKSILMAPNPNLITIALRGIFVGIVTGFVGAGGGFLIVPALIFLIGLDMKFAIGTSLMIIAINSNLGFFADVLAGFQVDWLFLIPIIVISSVGVLVGQVLGKFIDGRKLKIIFGYFVLVVGSGIFLNQLRSLK